MKNTIVVIGSSNVDMIMKMERLPRKGETITDANFVQTFGGKGANTAVGAARAGGRVAFVNAVGEDAYTPMMVENFIKDGIDCRYIFHEKGIASGHALVMIGGEGDNYLSVAPGANYRLDQKKIDQCIELLKNASYVLLQNEIPNDTNSYIIELAHSLQIPILWNFAPAKKRDLQSLEKVELLIVNETEAEFLAEKNFNKNCGYEDIAKCILKKGPKNVIITLGKSGVFVWHETCKGHIPAFAVEAIDSTAAGDIFCGCIAVQLTEGKDIADAIRFASAASALSVTRLGAQPSAPLRKEIDDFLSANTFR
ncbi:MAG: ribokinase [Cyclobacteriaceae bacterium]|nr:ribokinase [Cyclobacteriaceae bacterium]